MEPPRPAPHEVLLRVHASSVNRADWCMLTGTPILARFFFGLLRPTRPIAGIDVAGRVEAVGAAVTTLAIGDEVYGQSRATWAEYAAVDARLLARKPASATWEEAAAVPVAGLTALQGLRDIARLQPGQRVLVNGASGGVGTFTVQLARAMGARVTAVCSARNAELVRSIGADDVVDYAREDFSSRDERYDVIFDLVGSVPISRGRRVLERQGVFISSVGATGWLLRALVASLLPGPRVAILAAKCRSSDLDELAAYIDRGEVKPVIDRRYALDEIREAMRYQGEGRTRGKCVLTIAA